MLPVTGVQNHISVFISHCAEDNDEAKRWERLLKKVGFDVLQYGHSLLPGDKLTTVASQIERCNFFLLLVSDLSVKSRWVQQELGLALEVQNRHGSYRPLIIPLYTKTWSSDIDMDTCFPTREFYSGETRADFPIGKVRGLNRYRYPKSDSDKILINMMMPAVFVSGSHFSDEDTFIKTGVFTLYNELFPEIERDSSQDIVDWVLRRDTGEPRRVPLSGGTEVVYKLDSRFFILVLAGRAIGFAFVTYDFTNRIVYGNYMAVQECWRSGGIARAFARRIEGVLRHLFPEYIGTVFEVETLDENDLERIISELEARDDKEFGSEQDRTQMRRFLRLIVYQSLGCQFFLRRDNKRPAVCRSPCLDVSQSVEVWEKNEEDYWLMWYNRCDLPLASDAAEEVWSKCVKSIRIEILAKSVMDAEPGFADEYWRHANAVVARTLMETKAQGVCLGKFLDRRDWDLYERWLRLGMPIPI